MYKVGQEVLFFGDGRVEYCTVREGSIGINKRYILSSSSNERFCDPFYCFESKIFPYTKIGYLLYV